MKDKKADGLRSVQKSKEMPYKTWLIENSYLKPVLNYKSIKNPHNAARQLFPQTFWPVGYIEIYDSKLILREKTLMSKRIIPFIIEEEKCINIGSIIDLQKAEKYTSKYLL
jgi:CMP-N-acetylneuraminic acid synthetase